MSASPPTDPTGASTLDQQDKLPRSTHAFYLSTRMISIRLLEDDPEADQLDSAQRAPDIVKGRVFLYDDATKTLILKLWSDELRQYTGMATYNAANVELVEMHVLSDLGATPNLGRPAEDGEALQPQDEAKMLTREFSCGEDSYSKIVMDRTERFCKAQIQKRK